MLMVACNLFFPSDIIIRLLKVMSGKHKTNEEGKKPQEGGSEKAQREKSDGPIAGSQQLSLEELLAWKKGKKVAEAQEKERRRLQVLYNARMATSQGEAVMDWSSQSAADAMKLKKSTWKDAVVSHEMAGAGTVGGLQSSKKRQRPDQDESDDEVLAQVSKGKERVRPKTPPTVKMGSPVVSEPTNVDYIVDSVSRSEVLRKRRRTDKDESDSEVLVKVSKGKGRVRPKTPPIVKMGSPIASESTEVQSLWSVESSDERIVSSSTTRDRNILGEDRKCRRCSKSGATCIVSERYYNLLMDFEKTGKVPVKHEACEVCRGMKVKCVIGGGQPEAVTKDRTTRKGEKGTAGGSATCVTRSQPQAETEGGHGGLINGIAR